MQENFIDPSAHPLHEVTGMQDCASEMEKLTVLAGERGARAKQIDPGDIVVAEWVRFKCRYGCKGYGKHFGCPPVRPGAGGDPAYDRGIRNGAADPF